MKMSFYPAWVLAYHIISGKFRRLENWMYHTPGNISQQDNFLKQLATEFLLRSEGAIILITVYCQIFES